MGGSLCCCGEREENYLDQLEFTHRFRSDMCSDPSLPPEGQRRRGFFYRQNWRFPSLDSWDLIQAAHSTHSAIQLYCTYSGISHLIRKNLSVEKVARDPLLRRLLRNTRDDSDTRQLKAEEQAEEKGFKPVAAELPGTESSEQVIAVFEQLKKRPVHTGHSMVCGSQCFPFCLQRDSALGASGSMEDPVEEFIYESDEDAPRPLKIPTSPLLAPAEKVEKNTEEAETKPSELKDEAAEEPELTCCGLCTYAGNP
ncbi:uncharacterized protein [Symphalangus syndactylus]|uniref:uncharacterized protein isoform X2 n=1 Tax=Symphalangus syndactylus TaxID=9590 RepID=UPI002442A055|nr:uncharacterized protein LOC129485990 isoform X1 [Symphalangus syndactylus]